MSRTIDYYFSLLSPWAFIGHATFVEMARRHGVEINYKPVSLAPIFSETGGLPLAKRHPARQRYRMVELQRWRERRGLDFQLQPRHWPFDGTTADRAVIAIVSMNRDPDPFIGRVFAAIWQEERDLADPAVLGAVAGEAGFEPEAVLAAASGTLAEAVYLLNRENAVAADVFGSPAYVSEGEVFWGQDRLELLDEALASGRAPYRPIELRR